MKKKFNPPISKLMVGTLLQNTNEANQGGLTAEVVEIPAAGDRRVKVRVVEPGSTGFRKGAEIEMVLAYLALVTDDEV